MATGAKAPSLTIDDAFEVLDKLGASRRLKTSIFFFPNGGPGVAVECARDLSGELLIVKEPRGPDVARVRFSLSGVELQIDFLRSLHGVSVRPGVEQTWDSGQASFWKNPLYHASRTCARQSPLQHV
jgi:hypothetical protein